jgi:hypothetical protein
MAHKISSITSKSYKYQLDEDLIYLISKDNQDSKRGSQTNLSLFQGTPLTSPEGSSILRSGTTLYSGDHAYSLHVATSIPMGTPYQTEQLDCAVFTNIMVDRNSSSKHIYCLFKVLAASTLHILASQCLWATLRSTCLRSLDESPVLLWLQIQYAMRYFLI